MRRNDPKQVHNHIGTAPELVFAAALGTLIGKALAERERRAALPMDMKFQTSRNHQATSSLEVRRLRGHRNEQT